VIRNKKRETARADAPAQAVVDLGMRGAVKLSASGKSSVSFNDLYKAPMFQRDLRTLMRIRELLKADRTR